MLLDFISVGVLRLVPFSNFLISRFSGQCARAPNGDLPSVNVCFSFFPSSHPNFTCPLIPVVRPAVQLALQTHCIPHHSFPVTILSEQRQFGKQRRTRHITNTKKMIMIERREAAVDVSGGGIQSKVSRPAAWLTLHCHALVQVQTALKTLL